MPKAPPRIPPRTTTLLPEPGELQAHLDQLESVVTDLQNQLLSAQKLASIGTMAAMLAHEYNNLATPVMSYAQHALDHNDTELMRTALEMTLRRLRGMASLSQHVLSFANDERQSLEQVNLREIIEMTLQTLGRDLKKDRIRLTLLVDEDLIARCNPNQLEQVLFNLILNARQAMLPKPGTLTIDAEPDADGAINLHVRDTGPGISPENLEQIFTPFFSTKRNADRPDRRGIGLGLAVCRQIVESWGGEINVESERGKGTTFTLSLPTIE